MIAGSKVSGTGDAKIGALHSRGDSLKSVSRALDSSILRIDNPVFVLEEHIETSLHPRSIDEGFRRHLGWDDGLPSILQSELPWVRDHAGRSDSEVARSDSVHRDIQLVMVEVSEGGREMQVVSGYQGAGRGGLQGGYHGPHYAVGSSCEGAGFGGGYLADLATVHEHAIGLWPNAQSLG